MNSVVESILMLLKLSRRFNMSVQRVNKFLDVLCKFQKNILKSKMDEYFLTNDIVFLMVKF